MKLQARESDGEWRDVEVYGTRHEAAIWALPFLLMGLEVRIVQDEK